MTNDILFEFQTPTSKQSKYKEQVAEMRKGRNSGLQKEQKEKHMVHVCLNTFGVFLPGIITYGSNEIASQAHRQIHGNTREPLLENITSDYDLELFRKAQARASEDLVHLAVSHLCIYAVLYARFFLYISFTF